MFARLHRDERGIALITAMLVGMVVLSLGLVTIQLSSHNANQSSADRKRVQAINAAEAGLDVYLAALPRTPPANLQCTPGVTSFPITPGAQYQVTATFYSTFPGIDPSSSSSASTVIPCSSLASGTVIPVGAKIVAKGTAVAQGSAQAVSRTMQTEIRLNPTFGGFGPAIFSHNTLNLQNNLQVNGNNGNNGDLYTNGDFICGNSSLDYGSVFVQGAATLSNSCTVQQDLRANGNITLSNSARIGHDATSSTGSITLNNSARIDNNARMAASTCSTCAGHVTGVVTTSSPSAAPPRLELPTVSYLNGGAAWTTAGYTIQNYSDCALAKTFILGLTAANTTKYVVRITGGCALAFSNQTTVNLGADLAIISDGPISTSNQSNWNGTAGTGKQLYFIVPRNLFTPATPPDAPATNCAGQNLSLSNNTNFNNVKTFFYTPCAATFNNQNNGLGGQIFAGTAQITNQFVLTYNPMLVPGAGSITGFNPDIAYLREITNG
jgi:hypothetical protein